LIAESSQSILLIDDNVFHRSNWQRTLSGLNFSPFRSLAEFESHSSSLSARENHIVFLDYELDDGSLAKENARKILELGFKNLFITTAHDPQAIDPIEGISGVVSKSPPSWLSPRKPLKREFTKLSADEQKNLVKDMSAGAKKRFKQRLGELLHVQVEEIVHDTWERAIFESVSDQELIHRLEAARSHASE